MNTLMEHFRQTKKEEWNKLVAYIQDIKEAALQGKYTDEEVKQLYDKI